MKIYCGCKEKKVEHILKGVYPTKTKFVHLYECPHCGGERFQIFKRKL